MLIENIRLLSVVISQDIISSCYFFFIGYEVDKNERDNIFYRLSLGRIELKYFKEINNWEVQVDQNQLFQLRSVIPFINTSGVTLYST